jgi:hypothetical protein
MATDLAGTGLPWIEEIGRSFERHSFERFHRVELPRLIAQRGHLVTDDLRGVPALAFRSDDGTTFSWVSDDDGVRLVDGDADAPTLIELDEQTFSDFLNELLTATGAVRTGRARMVRGAHRVAAVGPAISRSAQDAPSTPAVRDTLVDHDGNKLDLHRSFSVDDPTDEMQCFLRPRAISTFAGCSPTRGRATGPRSSTAAPHDAG